MNIFKILASNDGTINEPNVSSFLAYLLDPNENHGLGAKFLEYFLSDLITDNKEVYKDLIYKNKLCDLSKNSPYNIRVEAEFPVSVVTEEKTKNRDIDIIVEFFDGRFSTTIPKYSFCIENKIRDAAIEKGKNQLYEEISGLNNYYCQLANISNGSCPTMALIFLTPRITSNSQNEYNDAISKLQNEFSFSVPSKHIIWGTDTEDKEAATISALLTQVLKDESNGQIEPIYEYTKHTIKSFLTFIHSDFQSYKAEKSEASERQNYGKKINSYIQDVYDDLEFNKNLSKLNVKNMIAKKVFHGSGKELNKSTLGVAIDKVIVNDPNRKSTVFSPVSSQFHLFYYPDEHNKRIVRKLDLNNPPKDVKLYWRDSSSDDNLGAGLLTDYYPES